MSNKKIFSRTLCVLAFLCVLCSSIFSELQWPIKKKTYLSGSFGEFRKNHIHAGVDISTLGEKGIPVYASDSGLLFRIKIEYKGYGKAIYIKLRDGRFLVYAHLDRFNPETEKVVSEEQSKKGSYAIDFHPKTNIFINKGDIIGYSGDTGGVAPHIHLESRDQEEKPINIQKQGLNIQDKTPPVITGIALCNPFNTYCRQFFSKNTIPQNINIRERTGLAVSAYDPSGGNRLGIYQLDLFIDGNLFFRTKIDIFSYDEYNDNFLLCNKDLFVNYNKIYYHLFRAFDNKLPFYPLNSSGLLDIPQGKHAVLIKAYDHSGNETSLKFNINYSASKTAEKQKLAKQSLQSKDKLCSIEIEKDDLYHPINATIDEIPLKQQGELIPITNAYNVKPKKAVFRKAAVTIKNPANTDKTELYRFEDGKWKIVNKDTIIRTFTQFALFKDITPPTIEIISSYPVFRVRIEDKGSGLDYNKLELILDGKKVIAEYSINKKELFYKMPSKGHKVECKASDIAGNTAQKQRSF